METAGLSNSIIEFLLLTSVLVFILGVVSSLVLRVLKIKGKPKFWIYALLLIIPLAYPIKALLPDPIEVHVPLETWQLFDFQLSEKIFDEDNFSDIVSFPAVDKAFTYQTEGEETAFTGNRVFGNNSVTGSEETISEFPVDWKLAAALVWLIIFFYFLIRTAAMVYNQNRFSKLLDPVTNPRVINLLRECMSDTGLRRIPRLLAPDQLPSPMVMGFLRPRILLPKRLLKPEFREGLRFALLHELKHVHQHHNWWLLVESIIGAAYFFHPVILWAKKRIHEELEYICDRHVVKITNKSISYADFLLHEIWQHVREKDHVLALPFVYGKTKTTNRVRSILENKKPTLFSKIRCLAALCVVFFSFVSLLLCSVAPSAQDPEKAPNELISVTAENRNHVSLHNRVTKTKKEAPDLLKHAEVYHEGNPFSELSKEQLPHDDNAVLLQTAALNTGAVPQKYDTFITPPEKPGYEKPPERKNPDILIDEVGIRAGKEPGRQLISDIIQSAPEPVINIESEGIIVLAQNGSFMEFASESATVSETGDTALTHGKALFYMQQGTEQYKQGRFDEAVDFYGKAIELNPGLAVAYNNRGSVYRVQGRIGEAISDYDKAIEIRPLFSVAYANRGYAYSKMLRYPHAISDFNKAIALNSDNADNYYLRGREYYGIGRIEEAISDYNKAIAMNPEYITKMPEGITPDPEREDTNYASYAEESLKWHHGSLPSNYWDMAKGQEAGSRIVNPYQIKKKRI